MKIESKKYIIATKEHPIEFLEESSTDRDRTDGDLTYCIEYALLFDNEEEAKNEIKNMDLPDDYKVIKVNITYEL